MSAALATQGKLLLLKARDESRPALRARLARQAQQSVQRAIEINRNGEPIWKPLLAETASVAGS
jgi:hypothetical protein